MTQQLTTAIFSGLSGISGQKFEQFYIFCIYFKQFCIYFKNFKNILAHWQANYFWHWYARIELARTRTGNAKKLVNPTTLGITMVVKLTFEIQIPTMDHVDPAWFLA